MMRWVGRWQELVIQGGVESSDPAEDPATEINVERSSGLCTRVIDVRQADVDLDVLRNLSVKRDDELAEEFIIDRLRLIAFRVCSDLEREAAVGSQEQVSRRDMVWVIIVLAIDELPAEIAEAEILGGTHVLLCRSSNHRRPALPPPTSRSVEQEVRRSGQHTGPGQPAQADLEPPSIYRSSGPRHSIGAGTGGKVAVTFRHIPGTFGHTVAVVD